LPQRFGSINAAKEKRMIDWLFMWCVNAIYWLESISGISYEAWNLILFVFLQPALIVLFFFLWMRERIVR
jgi:hypothetical protein